MNDTINRNLLSYSVGREMFCPGCKNILDVTRAVELDVLLNNKLGYSKVFCATCFDKTIQPNIATVLAKNPGSVAEIRDGRILCGKDSK